MTTRPPEPDRSQADAPAVDAATLDVLRRLLALSPAAARQVRTAVPRRRPRRGQSGAHATFGHED